MSGKKKSQKSQSDYSFILFITFLIFLILLFLVSLFLLWKNWKNWKKKTVEVYSPPSQQEIEKEIKESQPYVDALPPLGYMPSYDKPTGPFAHFPYDQQFYSTPQLELSQDEHQNKSAFPENEAYFIKKSQESSSPSCRLSPLRMSFEKNPCDRPYVDLEPLI